ncbi:MAG TPA: YajD family HNH nuclease [Kiritimatiellia bacterium]|nr:YajD family HNH nuclease [Kiritimatiellia bacterium]HMP33905.1 YajD family HNH nuclease [Kiritimatiellia bacterium]
MKPRPPTDPQRQAQLVAELRRDAAARRAGYRERALALFPHVCARCARSFSGKRLKELTVHHRDHNHDNNPPDGSNWELLCVYCHDHEHEKSLTARHRDGGHAESFEPSTSIFSPFSGLDALLPKPPPESPDPRNEDP